MTKPVLLLSLAALALACGAPSALTITASGETVSVTAGQEIDVKLGNVGPATYGDPTVSSTSVRFVDVSVVPPYSPAGPTQLFKFEAAGAGSATITMTKTNPTGAVSTFTLTVNVQ